MIIKINGGIMKVGFRKINYKRRAKNLLMKNLTGTTPANVKRKVKSSINPIYGTKLSGSLKPKKKIYNKVYNKTSVSLWDKLFK